jgi:DUF4097 and DUF4098 domain-containing protein YvlB
MQPLKNSNQTLTITLWSSLLALIWVSTSHANTKPPPWQIELKKFNGTLSIQASPHITTPNITSPNGRVVWQPSNEEKQQKRVSFKEMKWLSLPKKSIVHVPTSSHVNARLLNGTLVIRGSLATADVYVLNGNIRVQGITKWIRARTVNGQIRLKRCANVHATSVSGTLSITQTTGTLVAHTVSGLLQLKQLNASFVSASSVSGVLQVIKGKAKQWYLRSFSGTSYLQGPFGANTSLSLRVASGDVFLKDAIGPGNKLFIRSQSGDVTIDWDKRFPLSLQAVAKGGIHVPPKIPFAMSGTKDQLSGTWKANNSPYKPAKVQTNLRSGELSFRWH